MQSIIRTLEANTAALAEDLRADVLAERSDALAVKGSAARLANDEYNRIKVGDYHIREEERTKKQQDDRSKYEVRRAVTTNNYSTNYDSATCMRVTWFTFEVGVRGGALRTRALAPPA